MFDFQEPEVTCSLPLSQGSSSEAVEEPSESIHETKNTNGKRRVSTRMQSAKGKSQTASDTNGAIKDIVTKCDLLPSTVSQGDHMKENQRTSLQLKKPKE
ncbi:unnamed protein product [Brassica oleracea]